MQKHIRKYGPMLAVIALIIFGGYAAADAEEPAFAKTMFYVHWYDVGQAALDGLPGVKKIDKGFRNFKEINTVYYDPSQITIPEMEQILKKAGTYIGTQK